eukprot:COSAG06_NODE_6877_length_2732_cov_1.759210_2_plen_178_part_01
MADRLGRLRPAVSGRGGASDACCAQPGRRCIFDVLNERSQTRKLLPCFKGCSGQNCRKEGGHECSVEVGKLHGGALKGADRTPGALRRTKITPRYARALLRLWRPEWGTPMTEDELTAHGLCKHAYDAVYEEAQNEEVDRPAMASAPATGIGQPTDTLCENCNHSRKWFEDRKKIFKE